MKTYQNEAYELVEIQPPIGSIGKRRRIIRKKNVRGNLYLVESAS
jgi:hypothetical protein